MVLMIYLEILWSIYLFFFYILYGYDSFIYMYVYVCLVYIDVRSIIITGDILNDLVGIKI